MGIGTEEIILTAIKRIQIKLPKVALVMVFYCSHRKANNTLVVGIFFNFPLVVLPRNYDFCPSLLIKAFGFLKYSLLII